jgi:glycine/D-amino acid oxidase-like deaminating enzyme
VERKGADVVVCGGGVAGVAAAYHLALGHGMADRRPPLSRMSDKSTEGLPQLVAGTG